MRVLAQRIRRIGAAMYYTGNRRVTRERVVREKLASRN